MMNLVTLVGRLVEQPTIKKVEDREECVITLAVNRSYKNVDGIYETDIIKCVLWNGIAQNTAEWCNKGDIIGVKGRLQSTITSDDNQTVDKEQKYELKIIAEKITFLSSKKEEE